MQVANLRGSLDDFSQLATALQEISEDVPSTREATAPEQTHVRKRLIKLYQDKCLAPACKIRKTRHAKFPGRILHDKARLMSAKQRRTIALLREILTPAQPAKRGVRFNFWVSYRQTFPTTNVDTVLPLVDESHHSCHGRNFIGRRNWRNLTERALTHRPESRCLRKYNSPAWA